MAVRVAMYWVHQHIEVSPGKGYHTRETILRTHTIARIRAITFCTQ
jgi:hypothetical protein